MQWHVQRQSFRKQEGQEGCGGLPDTEPCGQDQTKLFGIPIPRSQGILKTVSLCLQNGNEQAYENNLNTFYSRFDCHDFSGEHCNVTDRLKQGLQA